MLATLRGFWLRWARPGTHQAASSAHSQGMAHLQTHLGTQQARHLAGQVEHHAVDAGLDQQIDQRQIQHAWLAHGSEQAVLVAALGALFAVDDLLHLAALVGRQPLGVGRAVGQVEIRPDTDGHGHQAFHGKQPLPAVPAAHAIELQQQARQGAAKDEGQRRAEVEKAHRLRPVRSGEPVGEVQDDAGEEARLGHAQQEAQHIEGGFIVGKHHRGRHQAPGDHDAAHPDARANAVHDQIAGHFQQRITDKEHAGTKRKGSVADAGIGLEGHLGKAHIGPVQKGHDVHQQQEGQQAPGNLGEQGSGEFFHDKSLKTMRGQHACERAGAAGARKEKLA